MTQNSILKKMVDSVIEGDDGNAIAAAKEALQSGMDPLLAIKEGFSKGIEEVGERFNKKEFFLPELIAGAEAMQAGMNILEEAIRENKDIVEEDKCKVVIGSVAGDVHNIGKDLVCTMLTASGFKVIDLGVDVAYERFIEAVQQHKAQVVGMSALMTMTMAKQKEVIEKFEEAGMRTKVKIIIGGAVTNQDWADQIGADGYAPDAAQAPHLIHSLLSKGKN